MLATRKKRAFFLLAAVCLVALALHFGLGDRLPPKARWTYSLPHTELYCPAFSNDLKYIALVRRIHVPDGAEAESLSEATLAKYDERNAKDSRYADPEVVILTIGHADAQRVDWGWTPKFSPDDSTLAYARQNNPLSGYRTLAGSLAGNDIRLFHRDSGKSVLLAAPDTGSLTSPVFSQDGKYLYFSYEDATNGAFQGDVGVGRVDLATGNVLPLCPPAKEHGFFAMFDPVELVAGRMLSVRRTPTRAGGQTYFADAYRSELLELTDPVTVAYSWGNHPDNSAPAAFMQDPEGRLVVWNDGWRLPDAPGTVVRGLPDPSRDQVVHSPDGRLMCKVSNGKLLVIPVASAGRLVLEWEPPGDVEQLQWSADSRQLAVIITKWHCKELFWFDRDMLVILQCD